MRQTTNTQMHTPLACRIVQICCMWEIPRVWEQAVGFTQLDTTLLVLN